MLMLDPERWLQGVLGNDDGINHGNPWKRRIVEVGHRESWEMTWLTFDPKCYVIMSGGHCVALTKSLPRSIAGTPQPSPSVGG